MTYQTTIRADAAAAHFAALADPTRQVILGRLRSGPKCVAELANGMSVSRPAVSQHLRILKDSRLILEHREGTRHYFRLDPTGFAETRRQIDAMWNDALTAFAAHVEAQERADRRRKTRRRGKERI